MTSSLLDELERAERDATGPPPEQVDRMWSAIEGRLAQPPPELDPLDGEVPAASAAAPAGGSTLLLKIVGGASIVAIVVGLGIVAITLDDDPREPGQPASVEIAISPAPAPSPTPAPPPALAPASEPAPAIEPPPSPTQLAPAEPSEPSEPSKPSKPSREGAANKGLAEELALMQAMSTALSEGDSSRVLELVAEHRRDFPHGQLIEERSAAEARALCRRGKPKGLTKAEQFVERWPDSIHLAAVRSDCKL